MLRGGGRVVQSGASPRRMESPSRRREPGEDAQPKRQAAAPPIAGHERGNATGLRPVLRGNAMGEEDGPGDLRYGGRQSGPARGGWNRSFALPEVLGEDAQPERQVPPPHR